MLDERLLEALYLSAERRLLRRLRDLSEIHGAPDGSALIPLTQEELAEFAGAARATVNRVLREEQARGTLELQRSKTRVIAIEWSWRDGLDEALAGDGAGTPPQRPMDTARDDVHPNLDLPVSLTYRQRVHRLTIS
jgi:transcriptional regulator with XRE-family HTH domain